jgi:hypothetical protein
MNTNSWKLKGALLGAGLLLATAGIFANACGGDDNTQPPIITPDSGSPTTTTNGAAGSGGDTGMGGAGGSGSGGEAGNGGAGGATGGSGGSGGAGGSGSMCTPAGSYNNDAIKNELLPDGGLPPL